MSTSDETTAADTDHLRYEISQLEKMREQILSDMEALRLQENNLRAFETRLRDSYPARGGARAPTPPDQGNDALAAEWEKFQRARALLEAERRALTDDRILFREEREDLKRREEALKQRESWIETKERELAAKAMPPPVVEKAASPSAFEAARNLFSLKRAS